MFIRFIKLIGTIAVFGIMLLAAMSAMGPSVWAVANNPNDPNKPELFIDKVFVADCEGGNEAVLVRRLEPNKKVDFFARRGVFSLDLPFNGPPHFFS